MPVRVMACALMLDIAIANCERQAVYRATTHHFVWLAWLIRSAITRRSPNLLVHTHALLLHVRAAGPARLKHVYLSPRVCGSPSPRTLADLGMSSLVGLAFLTLCGKYLPHLSLVLCPAPVSVLFSANTIIGLAGAPPAVEITEYKRRILNPQSRTVCKSATCHTTALVPLVRHQVVPTESGPRHHTFRLRPSVVFQI